MSDHVFVCYARKDQTFVLELAANLKHRGVPIWLDQWDIHPGADWDRSIDDAIYDCAKFLIVLSPNSVESSEVRAELRTALDEKKPIIPVIQSPCRIPRQLRTIQHANFSSREPNDETALSQLLRTLNTASKAPVANETEISRSAQSQAAGANRDSNPLAPRTVFRDRLKDGSQGPEMIVIPSGSFRMGDMHGLGSDDEKPVREVNIVYPFALGRYAVTFDEYDTFAKATKTNMAADDDWGRGKRPVINVSWEDAQAYAKWLSAQTGKRYRLPSEAEWEYAARSGGKEEIWAGTSEKSRLAEYAIFGGNTRTEPVGTKKPNGLGLYDMSGNVLEWVEDCWHGNYDGAPPDGRAWREENGGECGRRVVRGGAWFDIPVYLRASFRYRYFAENRFNNIGFRLAQDLP
jgi:formylglycine-generating enzyme required for sulfatase activity